MNKVLYFVLGLGVGAAGSYFYLRTKFDQIAQDEINSVKEAYADKLDEIRAGLEPEAECDEKDEKGEKPVKLKHQKPDLMEFSKMVKKEGYRDYSTKTEKPDDPARQPFNPDPYEITEEEYEELRDLYDKVSLIFYSDKVLAYESDDNVFEYTDERLTPDFDDHFKKNNDEEVVYIRNDIEKVDYAIYKDNRTYKEVTGNEPPAEESEE